MDPTALHPRQAPRAGSRVDPARNAGPGPGDCHRQPPAGPVGRQSPGLPASIRPDLPAGRHQGVRHVPAELEKRPSRRPVEGEPARLRLPQDGPDAGGWDHHGRCHDGPVADLEQQAPDGPAGAATDRHGDEVGHCPGLPWTIRPGKRSGNRAASHGTSRRWRGWSDPDGASEAPWPSSSASSFWSTACRSGEIEEIDLEAIHPERMKHDGCRCPPSILAEAGRREIFRSGVSVSGRGPPARSQHLAAGIGSPGRAAWVPLVVPGLAAEETDAPHAVMEAALSSATRWKPPMPARTCSSAGAS